MEENLRKKMRISDREQLKTISEKKKTENRKYKKLVTLCAGTGCRASGCQQVLEALRRELKREKVTTAVKIKTTGCHGFCEQGPLMVIEPGNIFYCHVSPPDIKEIVSQTLCKNKIVDRLLYADPLSQKRIFREKDIPFYKYQERTILSSNKLVDPCDIEDYIAHDGYNALAEALNSMSPEEIIEEVKKSGLRGRGGGGFLTGKKWESCRKAEGAYKYVICNADEGDPGAYMDRSVLEGNPHLVIEGMLIAAFAIGAGQGAIYVRNEYPLAVENARKAVEQAREFGLLGRNILGAGFDFDIKIVRGGGAFVCGESSALMASLEGKVGEPRPKDIHTTEKGFNECPTNLNNVETLANVASIINKGAAWFAAKGTDYSKGTKIFALTGQVKNTGLIEIPMGSTMRKIVYDIGGGPANGNKIKAVQIGGPSGGCIPENLLDLPVDFDKLYDYGAMVGSGGMVVMDESACMVDVAKYFLKFLIDESCGKCVPCRIGLRRMLEITEDITSGRGTKEGLELLKDTAVTVSEASLCALGKTAPNPVLTAIKYFEKEFDRHIVDKKCPAGVCRELITYSIDEEKCKLCGLCAKACPHGAIIKGEDEKSYRISAEKCNKCGICKENCKFGAITIN